MSEEVTKDMIGCLCWFKNKEDKKSIVGILKDVTRNNYYVNDFWCKFEECQPIKPDEVKFYDYDDRYNCCVENEVLRLKIVKLENDIKTANKNAQHWFDVAREKAEENIKLIEKIEELKNE